MATDQPRRWIAWLDADGKIDGEPRPYEGRDETGRVDDDPLRGCVLSRDRRNARRGHGARETGVGARTRPLAI